jgi:hypothetical protein
VTGQFFVFARHFDNLEGHAFAGETRVAGAPAVDDPPVVSDPSVTPRNLPSTGGPVTLAVSASDLFGVSHVYGTITAPGGAATSVVLDTVGGGRYQGVFNAPANALPYPLQYAVAMTALDGRAQPTTVDGGTFTVGGRAGRLEVRRDLLSFGSVKIGSSGQKTLVMKNDGAKVTRPVSGVITTSGAPFKVVGAGPSGLPFTLAPGNSMTIKLEFKPTAIGVRQGAFTIARSDLEQAPIQIPLSGKGT